MNIVLLAVLVLLAAVNAEVSINTRFGTKDSRYNSTIHTDIVGGTTAATGAYPWIASLRLGSSHICGGTIISSTQILTAAHCVDFGGSPSQYRIGVGSNTISGQTLYTVSQVIIHEDWNSATMRNDIAILILSKALVLSSSVAVLPYATTGIIATNAVVDVAGWGTTSEGGSVVSTLRHVNINVISNTACNQDYGGDIFDTMLCAGVPQGGKDSCQGDSGGPLVTTSNPVTLVGVVSWGIGCARAEYPGVYTRVGDFADWISAQTKMN